MSNLVVLFVLMAIVIVAAYALGRYVRQRGGLPAFPALAAKPPVPLRRVTDRETRAVIEWLLSQAFEQTGIRVADDKLAYDRIVEAAQKAIQGLKSQKTVTISLPFLTADANGPKHLEAQLSREVIEELVKY